MHPNNNNSSNIPAFLVKLWKIVGDPSTDDLVSWNPNGSSFIIRDPDRFCRELLPQYFRHGSSPTCASFIRQLNMYGFRKVMNIGKHSDSNEIEFHHAFFLRGKAELLTKIKRKIPPSRDPRGGSQGVSEEPEPSFSSNDVLTNLSILREKQRNMDMTLTKMKQENELLWRELSSVQQRHKKQEQVLQKVIQFLVQIIQRSNQNIHVPRKLARMLQDSSVSQENSSHIARIVDVLRNNDSDCIFVPDENAANPAGAVIHEVTDFEPDVVNNFQSLPTTNFNTSILKPLTKNAETNSLSLNSSSSSTNSSSSSIEPLNILENLDERLAASASKEPPPVVNPVVSPVRYVAIPVAGDPNKLCLVPAENFTSQQISNFKPDAFCNVIALPAKETVSNNEETLNVKAVPNEDTKNKSLKKTSSTKLMSPHLSNNKISSANTCSDMSSKKITEASSALSNDFDDLVLSDLLQASKISILEDDLRDNATKNDISMDVDPTSIPQSSESSNYQLAIPESSSLVKSKSSCYPDFSILQDTINSPSGFDTKLLEQLLCLDDTYNYESALNPLHNEKDIATTSSSDDILGNELVQFNSATLDDDVELDQQQWLDFLNQESYNSDSHMSTFCGPQDLDVLLSSNTSNPSDLEILKNETALAATLCPSSSTLQATPSQKSQISEKKSKRRKME